MIDAGKDLDIRAGSPCQAARVEGGLLSYLSDITSDMTPYEADLGKYCHTDRNTGCLALEALRGKSEPTRQIRPLQIDGDPLPAMTEFWNDTDEHGHPAGYISSAVHAYSFEKNIAIGLINRSHWDPDTRVIVDTPDGERTAKTEPEFPGKRARKQTT